MFREIKNQSNEFEILRKELNLSSVEHNFIKKTVGRYSKANSCCAKFGNAMHRIKNAFLTIICCSDKQRCKRLLRNRYVYVRFGEFGRLNCDSKGRSKYSKGVRKNNKGVRKQVYQTVRKNIASSELMFQYLVNAQNGKDNTLLKEGLIKSDQALEKQLRTYPYPWTQNPKTHKESVEEYWRNHPKKNA